MRHTIYGPQNDLCCHDTSFLISTMATHLIFPRDGVTVPLLGFELGNPMLVMHSAAFLC